MAGKSNRKMKKSSDSSSCTSDSDAEDDPDYPARMNPRFFRKQPFRYDAGGDLHHRTEYDSDKQENVPLNITLNLQVRGKALEEPGGCSRLERLGFGRKRSPMISRRGRRFEEMGGSSDNVDDHGNRRNQRLCWTRQKDDQKKATILSWLIDSEVLEEGEVVFLMNGFYNNLKNIIKRGKIKRDGIHCICCYKIFTSEGFVLHGNGRLNQPYDFIFMENRRIPLLSCMIDAWNKLENRKLRKFNEMESNGSNSGDTHDDACVICADGGNLVCCDGCNSTYHQNCLDLEVVPGDPWFCPYCICRFCGDPASRTKSLHVCPQCERKYHWECHRLKDSYFIDLNTVPCGPFCRSSCREVHDKLEKNMVGVRNDLEGGFSWSLLRCMENDSGIFIEDTYKRTVCHSKLAVALGLMEDCFEPIVDRYAKIGTIPSVVYNCGSNFKRIQFKGFYTAILEKDEEIICVATLRIHGTTLAEMPFIATGVDHRRKGMCKKLMTAIESALCFLNVENLIIPSTPGMIDNWMEKYGFHFLDEAMKQQIIVHNTLMFHDSIRLQKNLVPPPHFAQSAISWNMGRSNYVHDHGKRFGFTRNAASTSIFDWNFQTPENIGSRIPWQ